MDHTLHKTATSFHEVEMLLTKVPLPEHYQLDQPLVLACDTSQYGLGAVLMHRNADGMEKMISYALRTLMSSKRNYLQIEKEALAIMYSVKKFYVSLFSRTFIFVTHKKLQKFWTKRSSSGLGSC